MKEKAIRRTPPSTDLVSLNHAKEQDEAAHNLQHKTSSAISYEEEKNGATGNSQAKLMTCNQVSGGTVPKSSAKAMKPVAPTAASRISYGPAATGAKVSIEKVNNPVVGKSGVDRIPPRVDTDVKVKVSNVPANSPGVVFKVNDMGAGSGSLTINGKPWDYVKADTTLKLKGVDQTAPGKANSLCMVALESPTSKSYIKASNHFSVAAYPKSVEATYLNTVYSTSASQTTVGATYSFKFHSDSGNDADLDKAFVSEKVINSPMATSGILAGGQTNSDFIGATLGQTDNNTTSWAASAAQLRTILSSPANLASIRTDLQWFIFGCDRTNLPHSPSDKATAPLVPDSGFQLNRKFTKSGTIYSFAIQRVAYANNGASAGTNSDATFHSVPIV